MKSPAKRPWLFEPLLAAGVGFIALAVWMASYSLQLRNSGGVPSGAFASPDAPWYESILGAAWLLLALVWVALAAFLNRITAAKTVPRRLLVSFIAAVVVTAPFSVRTVLDLSASDGWGGIGVALLIFQLSVPLLAVGLHCAALPFVALIQGPSRESEPATTGLREKRRRG